MVDSGIPGLTFDNYNQAASKGIVAGPVNPSSGYSQPTSPTTISFGTPTSNTGGGGGSTSGLDPHINPATGQWDDNYYAQQVSGAAGDAASAAAARKAAQEASIRSNISSAYQPIFDELDRQMAGLPSQQDDMSAQIGTLADQQRQQVQSDADLQKTHLDQNAQDEQTRGKQTLNDLGDNVRKILQGASFYLGGLGAGDSSAVTDAAGAIGAQAEKSRGIALNTMNQALTQIGRQKNDVETIANQNFKQIDDWKTNKLADIKQYFVDQLNQLKSAKANAQGQAGIAIANLIQGTEQQFNQTLTALDNAVFNYKASIAQWQQQRQQTLQDQLTLLDKTGSYSTSTPQAYSTLLAKVGNSFVPITTNKYTGEVSAGQPVGLGNVSNDQNNPFSGLLNGISSLLGGNQPDNTTTAIDTGALQ